MNTELQLIYSLNVTLNYKIIYILRLIIILIALLTTPTVLSDVYSQEIVRIPAKELKIQNQIPFKIQVRGAKQADTELLKILQSQTQSMVGTALGVSAFALLEAYTIPTFFSGSLIAGAVILAPLSITLSEIEKKQNESIRQALQKNSLIGLVRENLERKIKEESTYSLDSPTLEVVILAHGLTRNPVCLFADVAIQVKKHNRIIFEDIIYIEPFIRSSDTPPPICLSIKSFARNDGEAIKNGLIEYGQVIAAIIKKRTETLLWQD